VAESGAAEAEKKAFRDGLNALSASAAGAELEGLKGLLKELNGFLIRIRMQNRVSGAAEAPPA
jgi:hypothetical protein